MAKAMLTEPTLILGNSHKRGLICTKPTKMRWFGWDVELFWQRWEQRAGEELFELT